ncbi:hypothetical protein OHA72_56700 [Dactylosporangium sp. NBC_01737]|uniref:transketolase C-terminal domain-containing protein n=1 Tax=Dactylosporangium sp. NBC_01737 TaxID=2975959 RepID=UPI002E142D9A|nr:hypothetical protein OHA72_56700 [Dactylosporangium sp. NBC_01737]
MTAAPARTERVSELACQVVVPFQLHPFDVAPLLDLAAGAEQVTVAEESTPGGTWGDEVAADLHERAWGRLRRPVLRLTSLDSVIPAAVHLERRVLLQDTTIHDQIKEAVGA